MKDNDHLPAPSTRDDVTPAGEPITDHIADARRRAREMLSCETHLGDVDDWRQASVTARDAVVMLWLVWLGIRGSGLTDGVGSILLAGGVGLALYLGAARAVATRVRLRYLEGELERERQEIQHSFDGEREEVRALYAAKGFREPLLTQITDTLCADDDRLLKVMMEEELGLFIQHINHPLLVGIWNTLGGLVGVLLLAVPVWIQHPRTTDVWMPGGTCVLLIWLALVTSRITGRPFVQTAATWLFTSAVAGGVTYYVAEWLASRA